MHVAQLITLNDITAVTAGLLLTAGMKLLV